MLRLHITGRGVELLDPKQIAFLPTLFCIGEFSHEKVSYCNDAGGIDERNAWMLRPRKSLRRLGRLLRPTQRMRSLRGAHGR